jgi:hypothetical protein
MKKIKISAAGLLLFLMSLFSWTGCQTIAPTGPDVAATDNAVEGDTTTYVRLAPERVDIRGVITQREYNQGQVLILVEGFVGQNTRFSRAVILVSPITQIIGINGRSISLSELNLGQQVAVLFRGRYRESVIGFSAQATARKLWVEPLGSE